MSVILRHALTGFHYAGPTCWVSSPERALDLETVERAVEVARKEALASVEIIAWFDPPGCRLVFPVRFSGTHQGTGQPARVSGAGGASGQGKLRSAELPKSRPLSPRAAPIPPSLSFLPARSEGRNPATSGHGVSTPRQLPSQRLGRTDTGECSVAA